MTQYNLAMTRKSIGDRPLTTAEKQARYRAREAAKRVGYYDALQRIMTEAQTIAQARRIASAALSPRPTQETSP